MQSRANTFDGSTEVITTNGFPRIRFIQNAARWSVGNQNVGIFGNQIPFCSESWSALQIKCPIEKPRLPRRTPKTNAVDGDATVEKVMAIGEYFRGERWFAFETSVMIASNHDFVRMRQRLEKLGKSAGLVGRSMAAEITSVNEHVAFGNGDSFVHAMSVTEQDEAHATRIREPRSSMQARCLRFAILWITYFRDWLEAGRACSQIGFRSPELRRIRQACAYSVSTRKSPDPHGVDREADKPILVQR
jgi:hypothetical protein